MFFKDTEREEERDQLTNGSHKFGGISKTESIEFDNGLKLDLSSIDGQTSDVNSRRRSIDSDFDAIKKSKARVGDWETNFTLIESKVSFITTYSSLSQIISQQNHLKNISQRVLPRGTSLFHKRNSHLRTLSA